MSHRARGGLALAVLVIVMVALHQDTWQWRDPTRVVLGLLPVGLAWHAGFSLLSALVMAGMVRFAWPPALDALDQFADDHPADPAEPTKKAGKSQSPAERAP